MWFICLLFLTDKKHHQEALSDMKIVGDTATLTAVMAQHLFSPLIAGNDYVIDNRSENLPRCMYCPCEKENCKALMNSGCTALGRYMCPVVLQQFYPTHTYKVCYWLSTEIYWVDQTHRWRSDRLQKFIRLINLIDGSALTSPFMRLINPIYFCRQSDLIHVSVLFSEGLSSETFITQEVMIFKTPYKNGLAYQLRFSKSHSYLSKCLWKYTLHSCSLNKI